MTLRPGCALSAFAAALCLYPAVPLRADDDISSVLKKIEKRYNSAKSLQVGFSETYTFQGRQRTEGGTLYLRKPGRMRWEYQNPAGKLFISDGKEVYFYSPETNRAERLKLKDTEDLRAPMAFLLGRLEFQKDFQSFTSKPEGSNMWITAEPKSDKVPYRQVRFLVGPDARIQRLIVTGQDSSVLDFSFTNEMVNSRVNDAMFKFQLPPGAQYVDSAANSEGGR